MNSAVKLSEEIKRDSSSDTTQGFALCCSAHNEYLNRTGASDAALSIFCPLQPPRSYNECGYLSVFVKRHTATDGSLFSWFTIAQDKWKPIWRSFFSFHGCYFWISPTWTCTLILIEMVRVQDIALHSTDECRMVIRARNCIRAASPSGRVMLPWLMRENGCVIHSPKYKWKKSLHKNFY